MFGKAGFQAVLGALIFSAGSGRTPEMLFIQVSKVGEDKHVGVIMKVI